MVGQTWYFSTFDEQMVTKCVVKINKIWSIRFSLQEDNHISQRQIFTVHVVTSIHITNHILLSCSFIFRIKLKFMFSKLYERSQPLDQFLLTVMSFFVHEAAFQEKPSSYLRTEAFFPISCSTQTNSLKNTKYYTTNAGKLNKIFHERKENDK